MPDQEDLMPHWALRLQWARLDVPLPTLPGLGVAAVVASHMENSLAPPQLAVSTSRMSGVAPTPPGREPLSAPREAARLPPGAHMSAALEAQTTVGVAGVVALHLVSSLALQSAPGASTEHR